MYDCMTCRELGAAADVQHLAREHAFAVNIHMYVRTCTYTRTAVVVIVRTYVTIRKFEWHVCDSVR